MIFTIIIPTDLDWLVRLVRDFFALIRRATQDDDRIIMHEGKMEECDDE